MSSDVSHVSRLAQEVEARGGRVSTDVDHRSGGVYLVTVELQDGERELRITGRGDSQREAVQDAQSRMRTAGVGLEVG